jgi:hypothetical protein
MPPQGSNRRVNIRIFESLNCLSHFDHTRLSAIPRRQEAHPVAKRPHQNDVVAKDRPNRVPMRIDLVMMILEGLNEWPINPKDRRTTM